MQAQTPTLIPAPRVLVVDDSGDAAESLALLLTLDGCEVRTCGDAPSAMQALHEFEPQVVLLDIGLPRMSGYELATHMRNSPRGPSLLLIAITGLDEDTEGRGRRAGFDHHLTKPVEPSVLQRLIFAAALPGAPPRSPT